MQTLHPTSYRISLFLCDRCLDKPTRLFGFFRGDGAINNLFLHGTSPKSIQRLIVVERARAHDNRVDFFMGHVLGKNVLRKTVARIGYIPNRFVPHYLCILGAGPIRKDECGLFDGSIREYPNMEPKILGIPNFVVSKIGYTPPLLCHNWVFLEKVVNSSSSFASTHVIVQFEPYLAPGGASAVCHFFASLASWQAGGATMAARPWCFRDAAVPSPTTRGASSPWCRSE